MDLYVALEAFDGAESFSFPPFGTPPPDQWAGLSDRSNLGVQYMWRRSSSHPRGYVPLAQAATPREGALRIAARDVRPPKTFCDSVTRHLGKVGAGPRLSLWLLGALALMSSEIKAEGATCQAGEGFLRLHR